MSTITTIQGSDLIKDSRTDINNNFSALNTDKIETSTLDTDTTLAANSDSKIATQKAVKAYVDSGGNTNASETNKGIVEEATDAEVTAGTATGATGAKLFVTPAKLKTAGMIPLNSITLGSDATSVTLSNIPAKDFYRLVIFIKGIDSSGGIARIYFNSDTGNNYGSRFSINGGVSSSETAGSIIIVPDVSTYPALAIFDVVNISTNIKAIIGQTIRYQNAATVDSIYELGGNWNNTSNSISSITLINHVNNKFLAGTEIVIYG